MLAILRATSTINIGKPIFIVPANALAFAGLIILAQLVLLGLLRLDKVPPALLIFAEQILVVPAIIGKANSCWHIIFGFAE